MQISTIQVLFFCLFSPRHLLRLLLNDCQSFWWGNLAQFQPFDPLQKRSQTFPCSREVGGDLVSLFIDVLFWNKIKMASEFGPVNSASHFYDLHTPWNQEEKAPEGGCLGNGSGLFSGGFCCQFHVGLATNPYLLPYPSTICLDSWRMVLVKTSQASLLGSAKTVLVNLGRTNILSMVEEIR